MSQRRLETFPDLPRRLGTSRTSYKKSYVCVKKVTFLKIFLQMSFAQIKQKADTPLKKKAIKN